MVNKASLMQSVRASSRLSLREASACVDGVLKTIIDGISQGERVELRGLGSFFVRETAPKKCPSTFATQQVIPAHGKIVFRPCQKLRESVWDRE